MPLPIIAYFVGASLLGGVIAKFSRTFAKEKSTIAIQAALSEFNESGRVKVGARKALFIDLEGFAPDDWKSSVKKEKWRLVEGHFTIHTNRSHRSAVYTKLSRKKSASDGRNQFIQ